MLGKGLLAPQEQLCTVLSSVPALSLLLGHPDRVLHHCYCAVSCIQERIGMQECEPKAEHASALGCLGVLRVEDLHGGGQISATLALFAWAADPPCDVFSL